MVAGGQIRSELSVFSLGGARFMPMVLAMVAPLEEDTRLRIRRVITGLAVITLVAGSSAVADLAGGGGVAGAQASGGIVVQPSASPSFDGDAPDPDVVRDGSTYYAFTTGPGHVR